MLEVACRFILCGLDDKSLHTAILYLILQYDGRGAEVCASELCHTQLSNVLRIALFQQSQEDAQEDA